MNIDVNSNLDQSLQAAYIGSHPIDIIVDVDILEKLQSNIDQLEELCAQLNFVMWEVRSVMKI
jgi:hypothetical protein